MTATVDAACQARYHGTVHHLYLFVCHFTEAILNMLFTGHYYSICHVTHLKLSSFCHMFALSYTEGAHSVESRSGSMGNTECIIQ